MTAPAEQAERQVSIATVALGQHMGDHGLPHYTSVRFAHRDGAPHLEIYIAGHGFKAWEMSLAVDESTTEPFSETTRYEFAVVRGRLPDSGFRVEVRCVRRVETRPLLSAVKA